MTLSELERKKLCEYMLSVGIDNEKIHATAVIVSDIIDTYKEKISKKDNLILSLKKRLNDIYNISNEGDCSYLTFSEMKSNW